MARRNANGEGSIYRRKDGRYEAAAYLLTTGGSRKRVRVYGKSRADVHAKLVKAKAVAQQGIPVPDRAWRLGPYLDYWLKDVIRPNRRTTTYERYETVVRLYLKPKLGQYMLTRLTIPVAQRFLERQIASGKSVRNAEIMREVLRAALNRAMHEELLTRNVTEHVILPEKTGRERMPWSVNECQLFLRAVSDDPLYLAYLLLVLYGLRRGEVLGLRWCDVDFDASTLHVRQQLQRAGGRLVQAPLKTKASRRSLELLDLAAGPLLSLKPQPAVSGDLVFLTNDGRPIEPYTMSRRFRRLCAKHGLRRIRLHDLRHTQTTLLDALGVSSRTRQAILGHTREATTDQVYTHPDQATTRAGLERLAESLLLRGGDGNGCRQILPSNSKLLLNRHHFISGDPAESRTPVAGMKTRCPRPLDDGTTPLTEVMLVLKDRTKLWLLGRVAVKHCRQNRADHSSRSPIELWTFVSQWLAGEDRAW